ncbi:Uncharacterized protein FKW44_008881, partial [Caligus rogercresseyi]
MMIRAGCKDMEIMKTACVARNTVKSIRSELEDSNNDYEKVVERKKGERQAPEEGAGDPSKSCTKLAEELGVGNTTVRVCINEDLRYHFYKRRKGQILTEKAQENRFNKALKLLNKLKHLVHNETLWFFSDEKNFTQDQKNNCQNSRCCVRNPHEVPIVAQTKFPAAVIVFGIISSDGDVMPPHFFPKGLRLDSEGYVDTLEGCGGPLDKEGCRWETLRVPARLGALPHLVQNPEVAVLEPGRLHEPEHLAAQLPRLQPVRLLPWGAVERDTNRTACNTMAELKARITLCFKKLPRDQ